MKKLIGPFILLGFIPFSAQHRSQGSSELSLPVSQNLVIITIDGFRWQEVFTGADESLLNDRRYTTDTAVTKWMYWDEDPVTRRKMLLPFIWNVLARKGQLFGNRINGNKVNTGNPYALSYPGYSEMLSGLADPVISSNKKILNPNSNVLEYLEKLPGFRGKVALFSSWDVFPFIINGNRNDIYINSGYQQTGEQQPSERETLLNTVQVSGVNEKGATRYDELTFIAAREYFAKHRPRVLFLGLGETDEYAHAGRYDLYLAHASKADRMIGELWKWVQDTPGYRDNTTFIITTDHGRGSRDRKWHAHGRFIRGSSETWIAVIGPHIKPLGEVNEEGQLFQHQLAPAIAAILGETFIPGDGNAFTAGAH